MKKVFQFAILLVISLACTSSCKKQKSAYEEWHDNMFPEFNKEKQQINFKKILRQDIVAEVAFPMDKNTYEFDYACDFKYYNYGQEISLFKGYEDDFFISTIGRINYAYRIKDPSYIIIEKEDSNEKYGAWALASLNLGNYYFENIFMTPLSLRAYKSGIQDEFIFIQFVSKDKYMNVIFKGGAKELVLVDHLPERILAVPEIAQSVDGPINGPGQFWHQIQ